MNIKTEHVTITCRDHVDISGQIYIPSQAPKGAIMIAPATGIKQGFYAKFATYLAEQGYGVITYDNRGIGRSLQGRVSKSNDFDL